MVPVLSMLSAASVLSVLSVPEVFKTLRGNGALRRYHRTMSKYIEHEPLLRLLPALLDLPLFTTHGATFRLPPRQNGSCAVALHGPPGSGRSLALAQVAYRHATDNIHAEPLLLLPLARSDTPDLPPHAVLSNAFNATGLPVPFDGNGQGGPREPWLLLIDEWEKLPPLRRKSWRHLLEELPRLWPEARIVVALPEQEAGQWNAFQSFVLAAPEERLRQQWLAHLLPPNTSAPLLDAMQPGAPFERCGRRLAALVVLVLAYIYEGLPSTLCQLYEQSYALFKAVLADEERHHTRGEEVALPSSYVRHASFIAGQAVQYYEVAHALATTSRNVCLPPLEASEQVEVAALLVDMVTDIEPLYRRLWGGTSQATPQNLFLMGCCVRERPACAPAWGLRIVEALLSQRESPPHRLLLQSLGEHLSALFAAAGESLADASARLLAALAPCLEPAHLAGLLERPALPAALRWGAAEALLMFPRKHTLFADAPLPLDTIAHAARCYVLALGDPSDRHALAAPDAPAQVEALRSKRVPLRNRLRAARALLNDPTTPATLRSTALALLPRATAATTLPELRKLCAHSEPEVRAASLHILRQRDPRAALQVLGAILQQPGTPWEAQRDALEHLACCHSGSDASTLLAHCALRDTLPLHGRLRAVALLARRLSAGPLLLRRLACAEKAHPLIRAQAAHLLGHLGETGATAELRTLLAANPPAIVQQGVIRALGLLGQHPDVRAIVVAILGVLLRYPTVDSTRHLVIIDALGQTGAPAAVPHLQAVIAAETAEQVGARWHDAAPHLATIPFDTWEHANLPADIRAALFTALTVGETEAEHVGSFVEMTEQIAARLRTAALSALAHIGASSADSATRSTARRALRDALPHLATPFEVRHALGLLAHISEDNGVSELEHLLFAASADPTLCWLAVEQLGNTPAAVPTLTRYLEQETVDPLVGGIAATFMGQHGSIQELPPLRSTATALAADPNLRHQAAVALGLLDDPAATEVLINIVGDSEAPVSLRSTAAKALRAPLPPEKRQLLRDLLRQERQAPELVASLLTALGRAGDGEALALMLRYAQSGHSAVALAAIAGITDVGNETVSPVLVRVAQNVMNDDIVRLHAVIALLHLYGTDYLPFLRQFLESPLLPLQLQALDCLLKLWPDDSQPVTLLTSQHAPVPLRLRALQAVDGQASHRDTLGALLRDPGEPAPILAAVADILGEGGDSMSVAALAHCASAAATTPYVRRRCIAALERLACCSGRPCADAAQQALAQLAEAPSLAAESHAWAAQALGRAMMMAAMSDA